MKTSRLRVTLRDVEPAVVRVLDVPAAAMLDEGHCLFQAGSRRARDLAAEIHPWLGPGWSQGGRPVTVRDVELSLLRLGAALQALDLIDTADSGVWSAGPAGPLLRPLTW